MCQLFDMLICVCESLHFMPVSASAQEDLTLWMECLSHFNGTCSFPCDKLLSWFVFATFLLCVNITFCCCRIVGLRLKRGTAGRSSCL
jgi:hypothetical protein